MNGPNNQRGADDLWAAEQFDIAGLEDEIRADTACRKLLRLFYLHQVERGDAPEDAGALTRGADYFLRDFLIADRRDNVLRVPPGRVRQFAGNWYIIKNLEPNATELGVILTGIGRFYDYAAEAEKTDPGTAAAIRAECADFEFYRRRIEEFGAIEGDGYREWCRECPLEDR